MTKQQWKVVILIVLVIFFAIFAFVAAAPALTVGRDFLALIAALFLIAAMWTA